MCKFEQINFGSVNFLRYMPLILKCYKKYSKYLRDDFAPCDELFISSKMPYLWAILTQDYKFAGFVFLDNWIGDKNTNYSVELTTCFDKKAWGTFTRYSAKIFLKYCFDQFGLHKIKALIYPDNFRVAKLLKNSKSLQNN